MKNPVVILLLIAVGFASTFFTGFYVRSLLNTPVTDPGMATPKPGEPVATGSAGLSTQFLPGKHYFDDTAILVTKDAPYYSIAATVNRSELDDGYSQSTRVSYFDGKNWIRKTAGSTSDTSELVRNAILQKWDISYDPSRVLKQSVTGSLLVDSVPIGFSTGTLQNEIGMRSLPGYTKFMSTGNGSLTINGTSYDAYVLYTRIYSLNAGDIQFYDTPLGVTTDWVAMWDQLGNFYHVDKTQVDRPTPIYQTHEIGVMVDRNGRVAKSFSIAASRDNVQSPKIFQIGFSSPINAQLSLQMVNQFNKYPGIPYTWFMGQADGKIVHADGTRTSAFGLVEYIRD